MGGGGGEIGGTQHRRPRENPRATLEFTSPSLGHRRPGLPLYLLRGPPIQAKINLVESHPKMVNFWGVLSLFGLFLPFRKKNSRTYKRTKPALRLKVEYFLRLCQRDFKFIRRNSNFRNYRLPRLVGLFFWIGIIRI